MHHSAKCPNCDEYRLHADQRRHRWTCWQCGYSAEAPNLFPSHQSVQAQPRTRAERNQQARLAVIAQQANRKYDAFGPSSTVEDVAAFFELADLVADFGVTDIHKVVRVPGVTPVEQVRAVDPGLRRS